jgi:hypothetical protein
MVSLEFFISIICNRNEYQEYLLGGKVAGATTFIYRLSLNLGASTSWNIQGFLRRVMGFLLLLLLRARMHCSQ